MFSSSNLFGNHIVSTRKLNGQGIKPIRDFRIQFCSFSVFVPTLQMALQAHQKKWRQVQLQSHAHNPWNAGRWSSAIMSKSWPEGEPSSVKPSTTHHHTDLFSSFDDPSTFFYFSRLKKDTTTKASHSKCSGLIKTIVHLSLLTMCTVILQIFGVV